MKRLLLGTAMAMGLTGMAAAEGYKIGISNTVQGNGWREQMVCAMKAEALASGKVESLNIAHRNTDAAGQLEDIRNLIQAGVNATGFLSYLYLSPAYASGRGTDALSKVIHPGPESSLRGFRNLVWDLSGSADFVTLQVTATISGPTGSADRITLRRQ